MENEERFAKKIKIVYTEIIKRLIDPSFIFPGGGKVNKQLSLFITKFSHTYGGECSTSRLVDYCVFQIHKNRDAPYQRKLAANVFGATAFLKYQSMSSKQKTYMEDQWLAEARLTRAFLNSLVNNKQAHPQAKYIYMPSEEVTKKRCLNTDVGFMICSTATLMWSPFSPACQACQHTDKCRKETELKYPELYRIRLEEYGEGK